MHAHSNDPRSPDMKPLSREDRSALARASLAAEAALRQNLRPDPNNSFGEPWAVVVGGVAGSGALTVTMHRSRIPGHEVYAWKLRTELPVLGGGLDAMCKELLDYDVRKEWDRGGLVGGEVVHELDVGGRQGGEEHDDDKGVVMRQVVHYYTAPAAGGIVSPRDFLDVRMLRRTGPTSMLFTAVSITDAGLAARVFLPSSKSFVRARNLPGGGFRLEQHGDHVTYTLVSLVELGGWLLPSLVNSACGDAFQASAKDMVKHFESLQVAGGAPRPRPSEGEGGSRRPAEEAAGVKRAKLAAGAEEAEAGT